MATLEIDARVTGVNQIKDLDKEVGKLETTTNKTNRSLGAWKVGLAAVGVAIGATVAAGAKWLGQQEDINGTLVKTKDLTGDVSDAFGAFSGTILEQTGLWDLYRATLEATADVLDGLVIAMGGLSQAEREYAAWKREEDEYLRTTSIEIKKDHIKVADKLATTISEGYSNARAWRQSGIQEANTIAAKEEAEANDLLAKKLANVAEMRKRLLEYAIGRNPDQQAWQSTWEGDGTAEAVDTNTDVTEDGTDRIVNAIDRSNTYTNRTTSSVSDIRSTGTATKYRSDSHSMMGVFGYAGRDTAFEGGRGHSGQIAGYEWQTAGQIGGSQPSTPDTSQQDRFDAAEQKRYTEALEKVNQELEDAYANFDKWNDFLILSQDILVEVNSGLKDMVAALESLTFNDYYSQAREALYGGTNTRELQYSEAKANAEAAWDIYQTDTWNEEYLNNYNDRMDDLIGTLDDFHDASLYESKQQQDWAKATALYEIGLMQDGQDVAETEIDRQIELLERMVALSEVQNDATDAANAILAQVELETKAGKDATYLVQDAVDDVELATKQVEIANAEIEAKKTEKFNLESLRWTQTGQDTYQVWTGEVTGVGQKVYETVTEPTFGYVSESGEQLGFATGGYTGNTGVNDVAGVVHGQEYVINANATKNLGLNDSDGGVFALMSEHLREINKTTKRSLTQERVTNVQLSTLVDRS